ncbi:DUF3105 domain-containing protein [Microlunatus capsulatus]|uniref:DUF3105 domain-containing protein n=1 Tax=Microlunatus capsulatus TaxID=99117 RepID=A0ABS4Z6J4_9ACTN|nr:DUF3105 domain-containing protein [Microlunatus capsulatus]MBP2416337.1 hypothetical protein [Microlunatus capsulatus]
MAKSPTPAPGTSRRDRLASFEAARKAEQRRRTIGLFAICGVLALALLAYPVYLFVDDYKARNATITDFGPAASAAGCDPAASNPATGNQEHVAEGTKVTYDRFPPDSGPHYATPAPFTKHFYSTADRPQVETLVHNLEHGYTVVWYRAEAPQDQVDTLSDIAKTFGSDDYDPADKFIAAPWSEADGGPFPDGKDVVLTRWTADPANPADTTKQQGVRQACGQVSGAAIADFMTQYPVVNSPEPNGA